MLFLRYAASRVTSAAVTLLVVSLVVFTAIHLVPGRFEEVLLGPESTPEMRASVAARLGLDHPLWVQYAQWMGAAIHGDFGNSLITAQPIANDFTRRAPVTLELTLMAMTLSVIFGLSLGILAGASGGGRIRRGSSRAFGAIAMSVPEFVLGSAFVFLFSVLSLGLTVGGFVPLLEDPVANLRAMLLPAITLSVFSTALIMRTSRDAVLTVLTEPYITGAVACGESPANIIRRHVLRNAAVPIVTVIAISSAGLLGGAVIAENLFSIPGLGVLLLNAIQQRDYPIVQAGVMTAAFTFVFINTVSDLAYRALDPRIGARGK